jgi:actin related protein 2/3 complex subunit 2
MMNIDPRNEIIANKMLGIYREVYAFELPSYEIIIDDHGDSRYKLSYHLHEQQFLFSFYARTFDSVFKVNGEEFLKEKYPDFKVKSSPEDGFHLTLILDCSSVPKLAPGVKGAEKEGIRRSEEEFFDKYKEQLALFRRNFFASPYEKAFKKATNDKFLMSDKIEFAPSEHEAVWIVPEADQLAVFFAINFDDVTEKTIAKLILSEMEESRRHVQNAPSIQKMHEDKIPELLTKDFAGSKLLQKKYSNGLLGMTFFKKHYADNLETCATMLSQFRTYLKYHIQASKTYLHGRIRRRVAQLQRTNNQAKFEEEGKKTYRSAKGKNVEVNLKQEEKGPSTILSKK